MWDDLDHFKLPDPKMLQDEAVGTSILASTLINITNHYLDWAQHEPGVKNEINKIKTDITETESSYSNALQQTLAENFEKIPLKQQKNRDLQIGWVLNEFHSFGERNKELKEKRILLVEKQHKLDKIQSRMSAAKHVLDIGRSILSAMKEELRNL